MPCTSVSLKMLTIYKVFSEGPSDELHIVEIVAISRREEALRTPFDKHGLSFEFDLG